MSVREADKDNILGAIRDLVDLGFRNVSIALNHFLQTKMHSTFQCFNSGKWVKLCSQCSLLATTRKK